MFSQPSDFCCFGGEGCIAMPTRPGNSGFGRQGMLFAAKRLLPLWQGRLFLPFRPAPTTRGSGCSENEAKPSGSPHATVANDVKSPCRFSGRVKGAVRCTSSE